MLNRGLFDERLAECHPLLGAGTHELKAALGHPHKTHRVLKTAGAETPLSNLKTAALTLDHIADRHPHIFEQQFRLTAGRMQAVEGAQRSDQFHTGGVPGHQNRRVLAMPVVLRIGLAHHQHDLAAWPHRAGGPPLAAIEHVLIAIPPDLELHIGGI